MDVHVRLGLRMLEEVIYQKIGEGHLGLQTFVNIINHPALRDLPFILETPNDDEGYAREIALMRSWFVEE